MAAKLPKCLIPGCNSRGFEYTLSSRDGVLEFELCDTHFSLVPPAALYQYGRFEPRKGRRRRTFDLEP